MIITMIISNVYSNYCRPQFSRLPFSQTTSSECRYALNDADDDQVDDDGNVVEDGHIDDYNHGDDDDDDGHIDDNDHDDDGEDLIKIKLESLCFSPLVLPLLCLQKQQIRKFISNVQQKSNYH